MLCVNGVYLCNNYRFFAGLLGNAMRTMGMLDLGGGSTQITFMSQEVCLLMMMVLFILGMYGILSPISDGSGVRLFLANPAEFNAGKIFGRISRFGRFNLHNCSAR